MIKKFFLLAVALLVGTTAINAKITYVPLYIVDTQADVKVVKRSSPMQLFITQDDHKLILPEIEDSVTFSVYKGDKCVYADGNHGSTVYLPTSLVGDYEVRLTADTYYYFGYITLEKRKESSSPLENANWENITLLGSNTSQQIILDYILGLNVVEYNMKMNINEETLIYLSDEEKESYLKRMKEANEQLRYGLLPEELSATFPNLVTYFSNGEFGINYIDLIPILISCIQELKVQLDSRTETMVDIMLARSSGTSSVSDARSAMGNIILSIAPTSVNEPARVRYLLTDDATNAYIAVIDMGGRVMEKVSVTPSETSVSIDSGDLSEGIYICTLFVNGENCGTKRMVKTK